MQNTAGPGAAAQSEARQDTDDRIVSDLESLIEHVQATMYRIEEALVRESAAGNQEIADNIVVLDDVTPRYVKANAALSACRTNLAAALDALQDRLPPQRGTGDKHHRRAIRA